MKMKMKSFGVVFFAVLCLVNMAFAQRTISINLGANGNYTIPNDNTVYAGVQALNATCDLWNNLGGTNETVTVIKSSTTNNCGVSVTVAQAQAPYTPNPTYTQVNGHENRRLLGRYMDLNSVNQYTVTISNIPFARYRAYVILSGDGGQFASMIINGVNYCGSGNTTIPGTTIWGTRTTDWTTIQAQCGNSYLKEGVNYLAVPHLYGTLTVKNAINASRATLAAIQIEEMPFDGMAWKGAATENNWNNSTNWWGWPVAGSNLYFIGTTRTATLTNNFTAGTVFSNVTFDALISGGNTNWTIAGNSFNLSGNLALKTWQTVTMSTPMALQVSPVISVTNSGTMTLNGILSGAFNVTKAGGGTLVFGAANSYSGATVATGGTLRVSSTLRSTSSCIASNGATLEMGAVNIFVGGHGVALAPSMVISADASRIYMNTIFDARIGNVTLRNGSTWTSDRALSNYDVLVADNSSGPSTVLVAGTGASYMNGAGGIHLQSVQNFNIEDTTASSDPDLIVSMIIGAQGTIGGALAGIRKQGTGTMALLGANAFNGAFIIESGAVFIGTNTTTGTLGTGPVTNNATLVFNRSNDMTVNNVLAGNGTINQYGGATLTLGGNNSGFTGTLNITNGTIIPTHVGAFGAGTVNVSGSVVIDLRASGAVAPTCPIALSGTPTIRASYNVAQDLTIASITGNTTVNVDVSGITQTGAYKILNSSSDLGLGNFTFQLINTTPGLESNWSSDASGIYLNVTAAPKVVTWKNLASGDWDTVTSNWTTNSIDVTFADGDQVMLPNYTDLDAAVLTLKADYTLTGLSVAGNETDYTIGLDTGTALVTRAFAKTGTGSFTFPGTMTVSPSAIQSVTGSVTVGTLIAPSLTLANGASVTLTNDASRVQAVTLVTNSTLTIPSAAVVPNNVNVTAGTYPAQAIVRYAGGSAPATTFPFGGKQATFKIEKEVDLGASGCYLSGNQALVIANGGFLRVTNSLISCTTARLMVNAGGTVIANQLRWGDASGTPTSTIVQDGGTITVTGNNNSDTTSSSILFAHWPSTTTYDMTGGSFIAQNAQVLMGWDGSATWTISGSANVRVQGIRLKRDADGKVSTLNINGGLVEIGSLGFSTLAAATSYFNWNGGTIRATDNFAISMSTAPVTLGGGSTVFLDLNGKVVTMAGNFAGTGTLCVTNTGRIAQSGGYVVNIPNVLLVGNVGLQMKLDNALATSEKITTGTLTLQNSPALAFTLDLQNKTKLQKQYPLIEATTLVGDLAGATVTLQNNVSGVTGSLEIQGNTVYAVLSGGNLADPVYWKDIASGSWDKTTQNWTTNSLDALFDDTKRAVLDDLAGNAATTLTVTEAVNPQHLSFESDATAYTVAGASRITVPVVRCAGTNTLTISAPITANTVELETNMVCTINEPTSLLKASQIASGATLAVVPAVLGNVPTGTGMLELLSGTYTITNVNLTSGTVKADAGARAECEYTMSATKPATAITGAGTFAFFSTNAVQAQLTINPVLTFPGLTGTFGLETVGPMRMANANWKTTLQSLPAASTLFMGKGMQYYGAPFVMNARVVFENGATQADPFQDAGQTFGNFRFTGTPMYFSNNVHLGTSSIIRFGSDATASVWFRHSITGPGSTLQFGSGYTAVNASLQAELDCSNSAETLSIRNNGGTGRVTVNAWGATSLGNNLVSETSGASGSFIVNIGDSATLVNAAIRTVNSTNVSDEIRLNHASGSLTIDGAADSTYAGLITKVGKLVKSGNGKLTLSGNNTFGGGFVLNAGTVVPKHVNALGTNATVTLNGGVLDLSAVGAVMPGQTNVVATGTPAIKMNCTSASDPTINGITGVVKLSVVVGSALEGVEYKLVNSSTTLSLSNFTVALTDWTVGFGVLTAKADGIYLSLKRGTMIHIQ